MKQATLGDVYDPTGEFCGCEHKKQVIEVAFGPE